MDQEGNKVEKNRVTEWSDVVLEWKCKGEGEGKEAQLFTRRILQLLGTTKALHSFKCKWNHRHKCTNNIVEDCVKVTGKYGWRCCLIFTAFVQDFVG